MELTQNTVQAQVRQELYLSIKYEKPRHPVGVFLLLIFGNVRF